MPWRKLPPAPSIAASRVWARVQALPPLSPRSNPSSHELVMTSNILNFPPETLLFFSVKNKHQNLSRSHIPSSSQVSAPPNLAISLSPPDFTTAAAVGPRRSCWFPGRLSVLRTRGGSSTRHRCHFKHALHFAPGQQTLPPRWSLLPVALAYVSPFSELLKVGVTGESSRPSLLATILTSLESSRPASGIPGSR